MTTPAIDRFKVRAQWADRLRGWRREIASERKFYGDVLSPYERQRVDDITRDLATLERSVNRK